MALRASDGQATALPEMLISNLSAFLDGGTLGLRSTEHGFDYAPAARCVSSVAPLGTRRVSNGAECEAWCTSTHGCNAAQLEHPWKTPGRSCTFWDQKRTPGEARALKEAPPGPLPCIAELQCTLFPHCLERVRAPPSARVDVFHRLGSTWPPGATPNAIQWKTNATLVLVSYHASLSWLRSLPGGIADLVVYHKADFGRPNVSFAPMAASYVLSHLREQELCTAKASPSSLTRLHHPSRTSLCPLECQCGRRPRALRPWLQYFAVLPNYGMQKKEPYGGSREPYGYLQFILDFWDNMPPVVIFSQDDCLARGCAWGMQLPQLGVRLQQWQREWGVQTQPSSRNCLCKFIREDKYKNRGYFWYRWMSFAQERIFNQTLEERSSVVTWPQDATFASGRAWIRAQPKWLFEMMHRLTTVELACMGAGTIMWAHSLERLWFELFDAKLTKTLRPLVGKDARGACFLGARRR